LIINAKVYLGLVTEISKLFLRQIIQLNNRNH